MKLRGTLKVKLLGLAKSRWPFVKVCGTRTVKPEILPETLVTSYKLILYREDGSTELLRNIGIIRRYAVHHAEDEPAMSFEM
jgi:hypothetical protein